MDEHDAWLMLLFDRSPDDTRAEPIALARGDEAASLDLAARLALAASPAPDTSGPRARLFAAIAHLERFEARAPEVAALLGLSPNQARLALHDLSIEGALTPSPFPRVSWRRVRPGPGRAGVMAVLMKVEPGGCIPMHRHRGLETVLVLDGELVDSGGRRVITGETLTMAEGSEHEIGVPAQASDCCLCVVVNEGPVELLSR